MHTALMPRMSRFVAPGYPHHVTQRGVRSIRIFDGEDDRRLYLALMREQCDRFGVRFLAWCLMPNHVHLIAVPEEEESLARGIGEAHRRYTREKNFRAGVRGYLFQGRFSSCVLEEAHLMAAARYVELNPVSAGLVRDPGRYEWSSARLHLGMRRDDPLVADRTMLGLVRRWRRFLRDGIDEMAAKRLEKHLSTGRPLGSDGFVRGLERRCGRRLAARTGGRPKGPRKGD